MCLPSRSPRYVSPLYWLEGSRDASPPPASKDKIKNPQLTPSSSPFTFVAFPGYGRRWNHRFVPICNNTDATGLRWSVSPSCLLL
ncbi:unnamed protein product [Urochloa humidicola]